MQQHEPVARLHAILSRWWVWLTAPLVLEAAGFIHRAVQGRHIVDATLATMIGGPIINVACVLAPMFIAGMLYERSRVRISN